MPTALVMRFGPPSTTPSICQNGESQNEGYSQISIADTGWTGEERETMSEHEFDDMDMLRA